MLACHDEEKKEKSQGEPGEWVATSRKRLQAPGLEDPDFQQRPQQWQRWREVSAGASSTSEYLAAGGFDVIRHERHYRKIINRAALRLASFEPAHHTVMVCGRPFQVGTLVPLSQKQSWLFSFLLAVFLHRRDLGPEWREYPCYLMFRAPCKQGFTFNFYKNLGAGIDP